MNILLLTFMILFLLFVVTFTIYWFNLDMKLIYKITPFMKKHYDNIDRDRKI